MESAPPSDPRPGLFLAFEGVEGSGKTTQVALLAAWLRERGLDVVVAREPGSTPLGERVRQTVLAEVGLHVPARSELFLMLAARAAFVEQVVRPGVAAGRIVIADRFELSTLAYQGAGRGLPLDEVAACNRIATGGVTPDATVLLDVDPEVGAARQRAEGKSADRMEMEDVEFHRRVAAAYRAHAARVAGIMRVDAGAPRDEVQRRVRHALAARFPETFVGTGFISQ
ncbi:MAG: dTMP kinase [Gemmatimonadetes bacterium]|nr:dTMP kinase [Gemmatimonadota bacterium]